MKLPRTSMRSAVSKVRVMNLDERYSGHSINQLSSVANCESGLRRRVPDSNRMKWKIEPGMATPPAIERSIRSTILALRSELLLDSQFIHRLYHAIKVMTENLA